MPSIYYTIAVICSPLQKNFSLYFYSILKLHSIETAQDQQ